MVAPTSPGQQIMALWLQACAEPSGLLIETSDPGRLRRRVQEAKVASLHPEGDEMSMLVVPPGMFGLNYPALAIVRGRKPRLGPPRSLSGPGGPSGPPSDDILGDLGELL